jgi:hypothetical protein
MKERVEAQVYTGDADTPPTSAAPSSVSQLNTAQDIGGTRVVDFVAICSYNQP